MKEKTSNAPIFYIGLSLLVILFFTLFMIQGEHLESVELIVSERNITISENVILIESLNKTIEDKNQIIKNKDIEIQTIIDNAEIMVALSPLKDLISDDEIDELISLIPRGNPYRNAFQVTAGFGESVGYHGEPRTNHKGFDSIPVNPGTADWSITPIGKGIIKNYGYDAVFGKYITIRHSERVETFYGHLDKIFYSGTTGKEVGPDTKIGIMGGTGLVSSDRKDGGGKHLHAELRVWVSDRWVHINLLPFIERY